jgi:predicted enzyme related to lactoylglutathione lyase
MGYPVVHFELFGPDDDALRRFYAEAFGWKIRSLDGHPYGVVDTDAGGAGIPGGVTQGDPRVNIVLEVPDIEAAVAAAVAAGGQIVTPVTVVPGVVTFANVADPAGNLIGLALSASP